MMSRNRRKQRNRKRSSSIYDGFAHHSRHRARQRYNIGIDVSSGEYGKVCNILKKELQEGEAKYLAKLSNTRSLCSFKYEGKLCYVVFCRTTKKIITFLTEKMAKDIVAKSKKQQSKIELNNSCLTI